jgi:MFS family permease
LIILDTSIIGVALPAIQQHFNITQTELQWIFNAYVIAFGTILLLGGRLSDILGHQYLSLEGIANLDAINTGFHFGIQWCCNSNCNSSNNIFNLYKKQNEE